MTLAIPDTYVSEIAVKEGMFRTRVRYLYSKCDGDLTPQSLFKAEVDQSVYDMALVGFAIIREQRLYNETELSKTGDSGMRLSSDEALELFLNSEHYKCSIVSPAGSPQLGAPLYDPQEKGEEYVELKMPGKLTLFFPRGLKAKTRSVVGMQWDGDIMRYQLDRKFSSLGNIPVGASNWETIASESSAYITRQAAANSDSITSFELTEIRTTDLQEYPDALFNPSPDILK